jgi:hypothetical protein
MKANRPIKVLFLIAALYDGGLGASFLVAPGQIYRWGQVTPPNHWAYVQFPSALLLIFGLMFAAIARDPVANRGLIVYGIMLKVAYCGIVFWYWFSAGIPGMWKPFAVADLVMAVLFAWSYRELGVRRGEGLARPWNA